MPAGLAASAAAMKKNGNAFCLIILKLVKKKNN
jgi:hypothetical protein